MRRTLVLNDGRQLYLLPSGSAYQEAAGYLSYQRWGVLNNRLCLQDRQRTCYQLVRSSAGALVLTDGAGHSTIARLLDGDPQQLVWRYGLSLRTALQSGQVRLARRSGDSVGASASPSSNSSTLSMQAQRSTPFAPRRPSMELANEQPRLGRSAQPVAKDGTVGRFAIRPQGRPAILPNFAQSESVQPESVQPGAADQLNPTDAPQAPAQQAQQQRASGPAMPQILFSDLIDRDPGCYAQRQRCLGRCQLESQTFRSSLRARNSCSTNCLDTYICTR